MDESSLAVQLEEACHVFLQTIGTNCKLWLLRGWLDLGVCVWVAGGVGGTPGLLPGPRDLTS